MAEQGRIQSRQYQEAMPESNLISEFAEERGEKMRGHGWVVETRKQL